MKGSFAIPVNRCGPRTSIPYNELESTFDGHGERTGAKPDSVEDGVFELFDRDDES